MISQDSLQIPPEIIPLIRRQICVKLSLEVYVRNPVDVSDFYFIEKCSKHWCWLTYSEQLESHGCQRIDFIFFVLDFNSAIHCAWWISSNWLYYRNENHADICYLYIPRSGRAIQCAHGRGQPSGAGRPCVHLSILPPVIHQWVTVDWKDYGRLGIVLCWNKSFGFTEFADYHSDRFWVSGFSKKKDHWGIVSQSMII